MKLSEHIAFADTSPIVAGRLLSTKEAVLLNGSKLKSTPYSMGKDFSKKVQNMRRHLVALAGVPLENTVDWLKGLCLW